MDKPKMYVLVRSDLADTYRCVQGAHALAAFALRYPEIFRQWNNGHLIFLGVRFASGIEHWSSLLCLQNKLSATFIEPDQDNRPTAVACYDTGEIFKSLLLA